MRALIVGSGISGTVMAELLSNKGFEVTVVEKRNHIGGNCYTFQDRGVAVHKYGPHIFHTDNKQLWDWFNERCELVPYSHQVKADTERGIVSLPFSMQTVNEIWGVVRPAEFEQIKNREIEEWEISNGKLDTSNAEGFAISRLGTTLYNMCIQNYTFKQWGIPADKLPASIVGRLPIRDSFDCTYYTDRYVGIPKDEKGYSPFFDRLYDFADVRVSSDWEKVFEEKNFDCIVYTGSVDDFFDRHLGVIRYRTCWWGMYEGSDGFPLKVPVLNNCTEDYPFTRVIRHRMLQGKCSTDTDIISVEYPEDYRGQEQGPMYVVPTEDNMRRVRRYQEMANDPLYAQYSGRPVVFVGRLAQSRYFDMDDAIENAFKISESFKNVVRKARQMPMLSFIMKG